jgi:long-subunit acyl-CoA synthetase (AMP-forming)
LLSLVLYYWRQSLRSPCIAVSSFPNLPNCCVQKGEAEPKEVATMEYHSPYKIEITPSDIPSFIFSSGTAKSRQTPQYFDAETPTRCYSLNDAEILVKRVAKGLQSLGLRPSEKVLLFSGNRLHFPVLLWGTIAAECVFTGCTPSASVQGKSSTLFQSRVVVLTKFS